MMDEKDLDKVTAFDTLFTTNHIQMCKVLMSYLEPPARQTMAVYIKLAELNYTLSFLKRHPFAAFPAGTSPAKPDIGKICEEIQPYLNPSEQNRLKSVMNTMQSFQNLQDMMEMMQMMKELFPEGSGEGGADLLSGLAGLSGMGAASEGEGGLDMVSILQMLQSFQTPD